MKCDTENRGLTVTIGTRSYRIILDFNAYTVRLARVGAEPEWSVSLACDEGVWSAC